MPRISFIPGLLALVLCLPLSATAGMGGQVRPQTRPATGLDWHQAHAALHDAHDRGDLDDGTYALYLTYLVRAPERLPADFQPDLTRKIEPTAGGVGHRCMTTALLEAFQLREAMSPEQAQLAAAVGGRPTPCAGCDTCNTHTCVHWVNSGDATYANQLANYLEDSWNVEINQMGWFAPPDDGTAGGNGLYDMYVDNTGFGGAYTAPEFGNPGTSWADATSYIVIDAGLPNYVLSSFAAHEFNHSSQFAYDYIEASNVYEATATFMEDAVYDSVNDYTYFLDDFQQNPQRAVDYATYNDTYMYGAMMFISFLSHRYDNGGTDFVRDMWDRSRQDGDTNNEPDYFDAINSLVGDQGAGTLQDTYAEFAWWRLFTGANAQDGTYFDEAASWPQVTTIANNSLSSAAGLTSFNPPQEMGANYALIQTGGSAGDRLAITFYGDSVKSWSAILVGRNNDGTTCVADARSDLSGTAGMFLDNVNEYSRLDLVFANLGTPNPMRDPDPGNYATSSFSYDIEYSSNASDVSIDNKVVCGQAPTPGDDDDSPVGCLCSLEAPAPAPHHGMGTALLSLAALALIALKKGSLKFSN